MNKLHDVLRAHMALIINIRKMIYNIRNFVFYFSGNYYMNFCSLALPVLVVIVK